jgi:hypothetical protein
MSDSLAALIDAARTGDVAALGREIAAGADVVGPDRRLLVVAWLGGTV